MIVTCVHIQVKEAYLEAFVEASTKNHLASIQEEGNLRFDMAQDASDPSIFLLYEAYENENQAAAHKNTPHYLEWRETVAEMMAKPRKGIRYNLLKAGL